MRKHHIRKIERIINKAKKVSKNTDDEFVKKSLKELIGELKQMRKIIIEKDNPDEVVDFIINQRDKDVDNFMTI